MKDKILSLITATRALVGYIEANQVYDKLSDCGCGLYDTYRSDPFDAVINNAKQATQEVEKELENLPEP